MITEKISHILANKNVLLLDINNIEYNEQLHKYINDHKTNTIVLTVPKKFEFTKLFSNNKFNSIDVMRWYDIKDKYCIILKNEL